MALYCIGPDALLSSQVIGNDTGSGGGGGGKGGGGGAGSSESVGVVGRVTG